MIELLVKVIATLCQSCNKQAILKLITWGNEHSNITCKLSSMVKISQVRFNQTGSYLANHLERDFQTHGNLDQL